MKKFVLSFVSLMSLSFASIAMEDENSVTALSLKKRKLETITNEKLSSKLSTKTKKRRLDSELEPEMRDEHIEDATQGFFHSENEHESVQPLAQRSTSQMQSFYEEKIPEFTPMHLYMTTGCWGPYAYQGDHLSDELSGKKQKNISGLSNSRETTFNLSFTSDRVEKRKEKMATPEMTEMVLNHYTRTNNWGNNSFTQDRNSDLFLGKKKHPKSTRGTTFCILETSSRESLPDNFDWSHLVSSKLEPTL